MRVLAKCAAAFLLPLWIEVSAAAAGLVSVGVENVDVGGELGRRLDVTVENNLLQLNLDNDFLKPFLERTSTGGYIGIGKTIDAFARFAAYSGDARVVARKKHLVDTLISSQEDDGYIGMMRKDARISQLWDVHELSYIVLGLTSDSRFCREEASLRAATKLAGYLIAQLSAGPPPKVGPDDLSAVMGTTGLDEAMLDLAEHTADPKYRQFVIEGRQLPAWRMPIVVGRWGRIEGHAYAYLCESMSQARLAPFVSESGLWEQTRKAFAFMLDSEGLAITGACGDHECWDNTQAGTTNLGETCTTAYQVRFYDWLLRYTGDPLLGDLMERAMHNALFAAQSPEGRRIRYYTPIEAPRQYYDADTYCCPCNYRRILPALPSMIYYGADDGVFVNLYTESSASIPMADGSVLAIEQKTDYPNSGRVTLRLSPSRSAEFTLGFRRPRWASQVSVTVNGEAEAATPLRDGALAITRAWKGGDEVVIDFPMEWRLVRGRAAQTGRGAIMRGPIVYVYSPKRNPDTAAMEPRLMTLDTSAGIQGPFPDESVRPGGTACRVRIWEPGAWYPGGPTREITLTEYTDPTATSAYLHVPNPNDPLLVDDELAGTGKALIAALESPDPSSTR